jgi:hypothetical protein
LKAQVHFCLRGVWDAVADELHVGVSREDCPQEVAEGVVLVVEDVGGATLVVLLLLDDEALLWLTLLGSHGLFE